MEPPRLFFQLNKLRPLREGKAPVSMGVAVADEPGVEVVSVQEDVAKPAPVAVYGISGAVLLE